MKLLSSIAMVLVLGAAACGAKKDKEPDGAGSGSAAIAQKPGSDWGSAGSAGSAAAMGSGSAVVVAAGSGSAVVAAGSGGIAQGPGSDWGSAGSAAAGSAGSAVAVAVAGSDAGSGSDMDMAFDKLSHDDKVKLMKEHVTPDMKKAFQDFDGKKYANFGCKTCHGKDPAKTKFKMPNPELPKLDFEAIKAGKQAPKTAKFMDEVVEPKMVELLGAKKFDMTTMTGFGCLGCHEQKK